MKIISKNNVEEPELILCENEDCWCEYDPEEYDQCPLCNHVPKKEK